MKKFKYLLILFLILSLLTGIIILTKSTPNEDSNQEPVAQITNSPVQKNIFQPSVLNVEDVWRRRKNLEGKKVTVQGPVKVHWSCTEMPCESTAEKYCKRCTGSLRIQLADYSRIDLRDQEGKPINCSAKGNNENQVKDINCPQLKPSNTYRLTGTFNFANEWTYQGKHVEIYDLTVFDYKKL